MRGHLLVYTCRIRRSFHSGLLRADIGGYAQRISADGPVRSVLPARIRTIRLPWQFGEDRSEVADDPAQIRRFNCHAAPSAPVEIRARRDRATALRP